MRSACFFATYFTGEEIPYYHRYYLDELKRHFDEVVFLYSNGELSSTSIGFLEQNGIIAQKELNEGFDFGMWQKASEKYDLLKYDRVAFVNDSCVLFKPLNDFFNWMASNPADVHGITESHAVSHHLQSYFLVFEKRALPFVKEYFSLNGIQRSIHDVIKIYEIGLSSYLQKKECALRAYMDNGNYKGEFSPYYFLLEEHIKQGVPVIKKKIIYSSYRDTELNTLARMNFNIDVSHYIRLIRKQNSANDLIDFDKLLHDQPNEMSSGQRLVYNNKRIFYKTFRPVYRLIKGK